MLDVFRRDGTFEGTPSATTVTLVVGPPGAGKSTFVQDVAVDGDLVVDYDLIVEALGFRPHSTVKFEPAMVARNALLEALRRGRFDVPRAWVVSSNPAAEALLPHDEVVLIDPGRDVTLDRCRKAGRPSAWFGLVDDWYAKRGG